MNVLAAIRREQQKLEKQVKLQGQKVAAIADVLKRELPFDSLTASWDAEDGTDDFTIGILARWRDSYHCIMIYTHYLDGPPEPKGMYPADCCANGDASNFFLRPLARRSVRSLWNSRAVDGKSMRLCALVLV